MYVDRSAPPLLLPRFVRLDVPRGLPDIRPTCQGQEVSKKVPGALWGLKNQILRGHTDS